MENYKILLGTTGTIVHLSSYLFYFWGIYKEGTKPHAFTWLVWGILNGIAFPAVLLSDGGIGAWVLGTNTLACLIVAFIGFRQKHVVYDTYDWWALVGGILGGVLWWITSNPLYAVILVSISDTVAIIPTMRKAYKNPFEENIPGFTMSIPGYILSIFALEKLSVTTWLYPVVIIIVDILLVVLIVTRRKQLRD